MISKNKSLADAILRGMLCNYTRPLPDGCLDVLGLQYNI